MALATSNRDGGRTNEAGHLRSVTKSLIGEVIAGLKVSQRAAGANMSVDISIGDAVIKRSDNTYGHPAWNDAVLNKAVTAADGSNPRKDLVVMYIDYNESPSTGVSNNTNGVVKVEIVEGTPAGSPTEPNDGSIQSAIGSGNPYVILALIDVGTGVTSISNSVITDRRKLAAGKEVPGVVKDYAGATLPVGYLFCDGASLLRADYPELFLAIGTTYGAADSTHFNVPDVKGRVIAGKDNMGGSSSNRLTSPIDGDTLGAAGGNEAHTHDLSDAGWAQITVTAAGNVLARIISAVSWTSNRRASASSGSNASFTEGAALDGATDSGRTVQPTIIMNKIIAY